MRQESFHAAGTDQPVAAVVISVATCLRILDIGDAQLQGRVHFDKLLALLWRRESSHRHVESGGLLVHLGASSSQRKCGFHNGGSGTVKSISEDGGGSGNTVLAGRLRSLREVERHHAVAGTAARRRYNVVPPSAKNRKQGPEILLRSIISIMSSDGCPVLTPEKE